MTENKKNALKAGAAIALAVLIACGGLYAAITSSLDTKSTYRVGAVDIALSGGLLQPDGGLMENQSPVRLEDGKSVDRSTVITNLGEPCYIRCANVYTSEFGQLEHTVYAGDAAGMWVAAPDGYLYFTAPLASGDTIEFRDTVKAPAQWLGSKGEFSMSAVITSEAVQAENFAPDFAAQKPWGDVAPAVSLTEPTEGSVG